MKTKDHKNKCKLASTYSYHLFQCNVIYSYPSIVDKTNSGFQNTITLKQCHVFQ